MEKKAFELVVARLEAALTEQNFVRQTVEIKDESGRIALFTSEGIAYSVLYDNKKKRFELRTCAMTDQGPDNEWKTLATWLFDPEVDTEREAESIANDFVETIQGPKRTAVVQQAVKKKKKDDEGNVDPLFFANRLVAVFPELKDEVKEEKEGYERFRGVTFAKEKILPKLLMLAQQDIETDRLEKMYTVLSDAYSVGDLDVRGIITMVLLNSIEQQQAVARAEEMLSPELLKAWKNSRKFKGKNIKPEKKKKEKKFMADTLNSRKFG